mmetsp:Transcript_147465/g.274837  ORF Transcript_147465/g.274837 Transcript_147465/m.274837 type:complete len:108 (+) Transcript_147465:133-456(+)
MSSLGTAIPTSPIKAALGPSITWEKSPSSLPPVAGIDGICIIGIGRLSSPGAGLALRGPAARNPSVPGAGATARGCEAPWTPLAAGMRGDGPAFGLVDNIAEAQPQS